MFLQDECGVPKQAALAYLPDGSRLTDDNIRELAGSQDDVRNIILLFGNLLIERKTIFVFNKFYLDNDLAQVLADLRIEPLLQPPTEGVSSSVSTISSWWLNTRVLYHYVQTQYHLHHPFVLLSLQQPINIQPSHIWKQFLELLRQYFVNTKRSEWRPAVLT